MPDISRSDNETLARSSKDIMVGLQTLADQLPGRSESFTKQMIRLMFKFSGEPQSEDVIENIYNEAIVSQKTSSPSCSEVYPEGSEGPSEELS